MAKNDSALRPSNASWPFPNKPHIHCSLVFYRLVHDKMSSRAIISMKMDHEFKGNSMVCEKAITMAIYGSSIPRNYFYGWQTIKWDFSIQENTNYFYVFSIFCHGLWDFPWNKPSRNWGSSMTMETPMLCQWGQWGQWGHHDSVGETQHCWRWVAGEIPLKIHESLLVFSHFYAFLTSMWCAEIQMFHP